MPLLGKTLRCNDFQYLIERVSQNPLGWTWQQLSLTVQITLAKSIIQSLPIYPMMTTMIPKTMLSQKKFMS